MTEDNLNPNPGNSMPAKHPRERRFLRLLVCLLLLYLVAAYLVVPWIWRRTMARHPNLSEGPRLTHTLSGIPGDPVNLALIGSEEKLIRSLTNAKWYPADPITLRSSLRIAVDTFLRRPDDDAPVSGLFLFNRKQDLAFEQPVGHSPRQRHHVRFWRWDRQFEGQPVWFGAATYDERVGFSHTTGQITHHIGPEIDAERDGLMKELQETDRTTETYYIDNFHRQLQGRNGGGDPWQTDGRLGVVLMTPVAPESAPTTTPVQ
jgi:hypothetical protein